MDNLLFNEDIYIADYNNCINDGTEESYNVTCELLEKKRRRKKKRKKRKSLINEENLIDLMLRKEKLLKL